MNKIINKMERKIGKHAIHNLSLYIICAYAIGYALYITGVIGKFESNPLEIFTLNPYGIFVRGEVWRIVTWIVVPPQKSLLFAVIMLWVYYQLGSVLERQWGAFKYNLYIFSGMFFTCVGAIILYFVLIFSGWDPISVGESISSAFSTYYINMSIFLAFATLFPDVQMLLYFIIPIKIKWLAYIDVALLAWDFVNCHSYAARFAIVMSLLNFIIFFLGTRDYKRVSPREVKRKREFKKAYYENAGTASGFNGFSGKGADSVSKHKCAICGQTEKDNEMLEFRFCSKCNGNYEYCSEHLFTHEHVK